MGIKQQQEKTGNRNNRWNLFKNVLCKKRCEILSVCCTLIFTLVGFLLTIGDGYFSQYYNDFKKMLFQEKVYYDEIIAASDSVTPKYYFILDVSGSIKQMPDVELSKSIEQKIEAINHSKYMPHTGFNFDLIKNKSKKISYRRLLQVHLLYTLYRLFESKKESMSVIFFSDRPEWKSPQIVSYEDRKKIFDEIYKEEFNGLNSNFINLFNDLQNDIIENSNLHDSYKRRNCHLIFFSDYKHETNNKDYDNDDLQEVIKNFLIELENKNVDVKLHYLEGVDDSEINPLVKLLIAESSSYKVEKLDVDKGIISPIVVEKPIPFYYSNSLFEENLTSQIVFNEKKTLAFGLESIPDKMKQDYYLKIGRDDVIHLSSDLQERVVTSNEITNLMIKGYIPAPYKSPDIVIEDKNEGVKYIIPVVFYKKFPITGFGILCLIGMVFLFMIIVVCCKQ